MDAISYFNKINTLLQEMVITDKKGNSLSINDAIQKSAELFLSVKSSAKKIMIAGNGGSAAIASHLHNDLANAVKARALIFTEPSLLTCLTNDFGYQVAYQRQADLWAEERDVFIGISSSGKSENILRAAETSLAKGATVITITGFKPENPLRKLGHLNFHIPIEDYGYVEASHAVLAHLLTDFTLSLMEAKK